MTGILKFNLPEESEEFQNAQSGGRYKGLLEELDNHCRGKLKYTELTKEQTAIYEEVRQYIAAFLYD